MIVLDRVTAGYGREAVLHSVSTSFAPQGVTCILGKNGCGKSTLLRVLANLLRPTDGQVLLSGSPLSDYSPKALARQISLLPQSRPMLDVTVEDLVMYGRYPYLGFPRKPTAVDRAAVGAAMERLGIDLHRDKVLSELSGGERQKVYLAMMLAQDAPILLMDEPTTYLDIGHQFEILDIIRTLGDTGRTVIAVMHDLSQALSVADTICLMEAGQMVLHDRAQVVLQSGEIDRVFGVKSCLVTMPSGKKQVLFDR